MPLSYYDIGETPFFACRSEQRVSYCLYVPKDYQEAATQRYPLVVLMHGTGRTASAYRDAFAGFAEEHDCIVLAPLFPAGLIEPGELSNYKKLKFHELRFDLILLAMIEEIAEKYRLLSERFLLFGFSGGGHFAHRFLYAHPQRLQAVSIGAPGVVTLLDPDRDWWVGTRNFAEHFGEPIDVPAMRAVAVQMVVGGEDKDTWEITIQPGTPGWMEDANIAGETRIDRMRSLRDSFARHGVAARLDIVPGVAHNGQRVLDVVKQFFAEVVSGLAR